MQTIGVFGLGYVGREVAALAAERGFEVYGIDIDPGIVADLEEQGFGSDSPGKVALLTDGEAVVTECDLVVVAVPTSLRTNHTVDLSALKSATESIADGIQGSDSVSVVVESTIGPGTLRNFVAPVFTEEGFRIGEDVFLAHAPERIDPGNEQWSLAEIPRVVGAMTEPGLETIVEFYRELLDAEVTPVSGPEEAEASKIIENAYRDINIAFVNEIAMSLDELGVDAVESLDAAETKPFGFQRFSPGAGVGGHCIPVDPYLLIEQGNQNGFDHELLQISRDVNDTMPIFLAQKTIKALNDENILPNGATVTLLGKSFKPDVPDDRNTPHDAVHRKLREYNVTVQTHDPQIENEAFVESPYVAADGVVLITHHSPYQELNFDRLARAGVKVFVDGRNAVDPDKIRQAGLTYVGVGRD